MLGLRRRVFEAASGRRRHLVLEPLPGRAHRQRRAGSTRTRSSKELQDERELERAISPQPEALAYLQHRRRPASTCAEDIVFDTRVESAVP